jgi:hypothetical protein
MVQAFAQGLIVFWMNRFLLGELAVEEKIDEEKDKANLRREGYYPKCPVCGERFT